LKSALPTSPLQTHLHRRDESSIIILSFRPRPPKGIPGQPRRGQIFFSSFAVFLRDSLRVKAFCIARGDTKDDVNLPKGAGGNADASRALNSALERRHSPAHSSGCVSFPEAFSN
jgi:hypothetical protein